MVVAVLELAIRAYAAPPTSKSPITISAIISGNFDVLELEFADVAGIIGAGYTGGVVVGVGDGAGVGTGSGVGDCTGGAVSPGLRFYQALAIL